MCARSQPVVTVVTKARALLVRGSAQLGEAMPGIIVRIVANVGGISE
jgi:hypothetical protein